MSRNNNNNSGNIKKNSFSWFRRISKKVCRENNYEKNSHTNSPIEPNSIESNNNSPKNNKRTENICLCCANEVSYNNIIIECRMKLFQSNQESSNVAVEKSCCKYCPSITRKISHEQYNSVHESVTSDNNNETNQDTPIHLKGDFLEAMLFPHLDPGKKDYYANNQSNNTSKKLFERGQSTSAGLIKELFCPAHTPINTKLFGGSKGVDLERERSKNSGYVIHPCSKLRQYWDLTIMTMLILNMFILPLDIAFFTEHDNNTWLGFHIFSDMLCLLDIVLNFRTGYKDSESSEFELDHKKIAIHYIKTWFALDLISSLPLNYIMMAALGETENLSLGLKGASRALKFLKVTKLLNLLKLLRLSRIIRGISQYEEVYCLTATFMRYIKLVSMMLMVAHWNGCLHFLLPMLQEFPENCWVRLCALETEPWYSQYGWALFKTLSHMLCIGYGRFIPMLLSEAIITIFSMVTGATFYALFIAHSMAFIIQKDSSKNRYQEKYQQIQEYMSYRQLPESVKKRVANYYEHKYHQGRFFEEQNILAEISHPLRNEIVNHTCRDLVNSVPFLKSAPAAFVTSLLNKLTFDVYLSGDIIVKEGTVGSHMFFIRKGTVDVSLNDVTLSHLEDGCYFGEIGILTRTRRVATVESVTPCELFALSRSSLLELLEEFPKMRPVVEHSAISRLLNTCRICKIIPYDNLNREENYGNFNPIDGDSHAKINSFLHQALSCLAHESTLSKEVDYKEDDVTLLELIRIVVEEHKLTHDDCKLA